MELTPRLLEQIDYHEKTHSYFVGDERYPSINEFADSLLGNEFEKVDKYYAQRGTAIHMLCEAVSKDRELDISEMGLAEDVEGFVIAWDNFLRSTQWESVAIEEAIYSDRYQIAGRPDAIGHFPGGELTVLDIKSGAHRPRYDFCSAGYLTVANEYYEEEIVDRVYVHVKKDGTFAVNHAKRKNDMTAFTHAAQFKLWRDKYYGKK